MTGWSASDSLRMLARRYHDERCQNRFAAASASAWVASRRSSVAAHDGDERGRRPVGEDAAAVERLGRRPHRLAPEPERLALVAAEARRPRRSPEKTVTIVTVWPSSRRLAIRPPHESATSSGWGATKTWVMAGRVYRARTGARSGVAQRSQPPAPTSGTKTQALSGRSVHSFAAPRHDGQDLAVARADRDHEPGAVRELVAERMGDVRGGGRHDDPVPWTLIGQAEAAVADPDVDAVAEAEVGQPFPGGRREVRRAARWS